jgi:hypothetical protein
MAIAPCGQGRRVFALALVLRALQGGTHVEQCVKRRIACAAPQTVGTRIATGPRPRLALSGVLATPGCGAGIGQALTAGATMKPGAISTAWAVLWPAGVGSLPMEILPRQPMDSR